MRKQSYLLLLVLLDDPSLIVEPANMRPDPASDLGGVPFPTVHSAQP